MAFRCRKDIRILRSRFPNETPQSSSRRIARTHLSMIETGAKQANFETIWKIAQALDMRPSELVERIEKEIGCK